VTGTSECGRRIRSGRRIWSGRRVRPVRALARLLGTAAVLATVTGAWIGVAGSLPAGAISVGPFSIEPAKAPGQLFGRSDFDYDVVPGQVVHDAVVLTNTTAAPEDFRIWAADAYNTAIGGAFAVRPESWKNHGVGSWIHLPLDPSTIYELPGNTSATLDFTLRVPADASPGSHAGGIVALEVHPGTSPRGYGHVSVNLGVAAAVFVHVAGTVRPGAAVSAIHVTPFVSPFAFATGSSKASLSFQLVNTGNSVLDGSAVATVRNMFGDIVKRYRGVGVQDFLPGERFTIREPSWSGLPLAGPEHVSVSFEAKGIGVVSGSASFWIFPWLLVVIVIVVLAGGIWLMAIWRRRRKRTRGQRAGVPGSPEGMGSLHSGSGDGEVIGSEQPPEVSRPLTRT